MSLDCARRVVVALCLGLGLLLLPGTAAAGTVKNGRIAFATTRDGHSEIYSMEADGSGQMRLTTGVAGNTSPAWSPDGRHIAFSSARDGNSEVYVMDADGQHQVRLTTNSVSDSAPAWSPDGQKIAFSSAGQIVVMNANGSGQTTLTSGVHPTWSPDSQKIAFADVESFNQDIFVIQSNGTGRAHLTTDPAPDGSPSWSPDGAHILFVSTRDFSSNFHAYVMNADGSGQSLINTPVELNDIDAPSWSPDGTRILFNADATVVSGTVAGSTTPLTNSGFAASWQPLPSVCDADADGDGLCDDWEQDGIDGDADGTPDLKLYDGDQNGTISASERALPDHKDLFVEIDFMTPHQPSSQALADVVTAFANAPVSNPDGTTGIRLHLIVDDAVPEAESLSFVPCTGAGGSADFDALKTQFFGTASERSGPSEVLEAKRLAFRYNLWAHGLVGLGTTSGCAELPGNDFIVSLGRFFFPAAHPTGTVDQQAGTFMHELGHTLGLHHGGGDDFNCKPNYLSIMSYRFQFPDDVPNRPLDYSRERLPTITETALNEPTGISGPHGLQTAFGLGAVTPLPADAPIDWNADGDANDTNVSANINDGGGNNGNGCNGDGTVLQGHNDWPVLLYDFRNSPDFADGVHNTSATVDEQTYEQAIAGGSGGTVPPPGGGQPPPGGNCADTLRPSAKVTRGSRGFKATRGRLTIAGTANDASPCASKGRVARVEVAVARKLGKRCRFLNAKGRAGRARSCHKPVFLKAKGTSRWTLTIKRLPARGTYVVVVRARDASGNVGRALTRTRRLTRH